MKKIKFKKGKFNLEKFEIAKLKNLSTIVGGGDNTDTRTSLDCPVSSKLCKDITG